LRERGIRDAQLVVPCGNVTVIVSGDPQSGRWRSVLPNEVDDLDVRSVRQCRVSAVLSAGRAEILFSTT
jgi:hypothetical protein